MPTSTIPMYRFCLILTVGLTFGVGGTTYAGLIADWTANGNTLDSSGNGHDGTLENGAGFGPGQNGQAFQFNGVNQYVSVPQSTAWGFGTGSFTIGLWANFNAINPGSPGSLPNVFIGADDGPGLVNKWVFFYDSSGNLEFHINGPSEVFLSSPSTFVPTLGAWNYYAVTRSGDTFTFYVNGISLGTATSSVPVPTVTAPLTIGEAEGLGYFNGSLDQIQIYNQALSASQILQLASVPEPSSVVLMVSGSIGLLGYTQARRRSPGRLGLT